MGGGTSGMGVLISSLVVCDSSATILFSVRVQLLYSVFRYVQYPAEERGIPDYLEGLTELLFI